MAYNEIRNRKGYSKEQLEWLMNNHFKYQFKELTKLYNKTFNENRSVSAIKHQVEDKKYLGLKSPSKFTSEEDEFIMKYAPNTTRKEFYKIFCEKFENSKHTFISTVKRAKYIKALRTEETISRARFNSMKDKYPIGYMLKLNSMEYIKVKNEPVRKGESRLKNYMPYHYYVLEQNGIKVKENQTVKFKDNNPHNCDLSNLLVISNSTMGYMIRNNLWNKGQLTQTALYVGQLEDMIKEILYKKPTASKKEVLTNE